MDTMPKNEKWKIIFSLFSLSLLFFIFFCDFSGFYILSGACACTGLYTQSFSADIVCCSDHRHLGKSRWVSTLVRVCRKETHAYIVILCGARMSREASKPPLSYPRSVRCVRRELSRWNRCLIEFKLLNMQQQRTRHIAQWKLHLLLQSWTR